MPNSLNPAAVKVEYASVYGPHIAIYPLREVTTGAVPALANTNVVTWNDDEISLEEAVDDLVGAIADNYPTTTTFGIATLLKVNDPPAVQNPVPLFSWAIDIPGTDSTPGYSRAVQLTLTFRTALNGIAKIVMLDAGSNDNFDKVVDLTGITTIQNIVDLYTSEDQGWAGRDNSRPQVFLQLAKTLNEKLRRSYRQN